MWSALEFGLNLQLSVVEKQWNTSRRSCKITHECAKQMERWGRFGDGCNLRIEIGEATYSSVLNVGRRRPKSGLVEGSQLQP